MNTDMTPNQMALDARRKLRESKQQMPAELEARFWQHVDQAILHVRNAIANLSVQEGATVEGVAGVIEMLITRPERVGAKYAAAVGGGRVLDFLPQVAQVFAAAAERATPLETETLREPFAEKMAEVVVEAAEAKLARAEAKRTAAGHAARSAGRRRAKLLEQAQTLHRDLEAYAQEQKVAGNGWHAAELRSERHGLEKLIELLGGTVERDAPIPSAHRKPASSGSLVGIEKGDANVDVSE